MISRVLLATLSLASAQVPRCRTLPAPSPGPLGFVLRVCGDESAGLQTVELGRDGFETVDVLARLETGGSFRLVSASRRGKSLALETVLMTSAKNAGCTGRREEHDRWACAAAECTVTSRSYVDRRVCLDDSTRDGGACLRAPLDAGARWAEHVKSSVETWSSSGPRMLGDGGRGFDDRASVTIDRWSHKRVASSADGGLELLSSPSIVEVRGRYPVNAEMGAKRLGPGEFPPDDLFQLFTEIELLAFLPPWTCSFEPELSDLAPLGRRSHPFGSAHAWRVVMSCGGADAAMGGETYTDEVSLRGELVLLDDAGIILGAHLTLESRTDSSRNFPLECEQPCDGGVTWTHSESSHGSVTRLELQTQCDLPLSAR